MAVMPSQPPEAIVLDVNETLTDMRPLGARLEQVGAPAHLLSTWFAATLRDGIALTLAGGYADFAPLAQATLTSLLSTETGLRDTPEAAAEHVLAGIAELPLHDDVAPGVAALRAAGLRVIALTVGSAQTTARVLERGGVTPPLEHCLSVAEVRRWKPAREPYLHAAQVCGLEPGRLMLAAVHPWDIDGALRAGLRAAWIDRSGAGADRYPEPLQAPELTCPSLVELAQALSGAAP